MKNCGYCRKTQIKSFSILSSVLMGAVVKLEMQSWVLCNAALWGFMGPHV